MENCSQEVLVMNKYTISKPIWDGGYKERCIGIADFRLPCIVDISYVDTHGNRIYPDRYLITKKMAKDYDIKKVGNISLYIIPISKLQVYELENDDPVQVELSSIIRQLDMVIEREERYCDTEKAALSELGAQTGYIIGLQKARDMVNNWKIRINI